MIAGIAIAGRAGSGKSTLARLVCVELERRGRLAEVVSFADRLKEEVWETYGIRKGDVGSRELLIRHGEMRRLDDPRYWVRKLAPQVLALVLRGGVPICDDVRREAEYEWLRESGCLTVRVTAPEERRRARLSAQGLDPNFAVTDDPTEVDHEAWAFDLHVHNCGDDHLWQVARVVVETAERLAATA